MWPKATAPELEDLYWNGVYETGTQRVEEVGASSNKSLLSSYIIGSELSQGKIMHHIIDVFMNNPPTDEVDKLQWKIGCMELINRQSPFAGQDELPSRIRYILLNDGKGSTQPHEIAPLKEGDAQLPKWKDSLQKAQRLKTSAGALGAGAGKFESTKEGEQEAKKPSSDAPAPTKGKPSPR